MMSSHQPLVALSINTAWNLYNFRQGLLRDLQANRFNTVTLAPADAFSDKLRTLGCEVHNLPMQGQGTNPLQDLKLFWRYRQLLKKIKPVAFLAWTIKPNIYGSLAAHSLGIPVINNVSGLGTAFMKPGWLNTLVRQLYRLAFSRSHRVFFQNPDDQTLFVSQGLLSAEKSALLPGSGIDLQRFQPAPREPLEDRPFRFLLVARMLRDKGVEEYVQAARLLRQQHPNVVFQCLGFLDVENPSAISRDEMQAWVEEGVVDYLGCADDVRPWLAQADCVVLPSYREGTPRTLLEAAAMARPLIATDVPGCRQVVDHGINGLLCEVRSAASLAEAMSKMIHLKATDWQRMANASRTKAVHEFDEGIVIRAYAEALKRLA